MFADRDLEERLDDISEASTKHACDMSGRLLKIDIDGMDQAKYKVPRNITNAHIFKDMWRLALHVVGILVWWLFEAYVLMEPDIPQ